MKKILFLIISTILYSPSLFADVSGKIYLDINDNCILDANIEAGIPNVTVDLYDADDNLINTTTTDNNGCYSNPNLLAGDYTIVVHLESPCNTKSFTYDPVIGSITIDFPDNCCNLFDCSKAPSTKTFSVVISTQNNVDKNERGFNGIEESTGGFCIAGDTYAFRSQDIFVNKLDNAGNLTNSMRCYDSNYNKSALWMNEIKNNPCAPAGGFIYTGYTRSSPDRNLLLKATDKNGSTLYNQEFGSGSGTNESGNCVIQDSNDDFVTVGSRYSLGSSTIYAAGLDACWNNKWTMEYTIQGSDVAYSVTEVPDLLDPFGSSVYAITGRTFRQVFVLLINSTNGQPLHPNAYVYDLDNNPATSETAYSIGIDQDGDLIITGAANMPFVAGISKTEIFVLKINNCKLISPSLNLDLKWVKYYDVSGSDVEWSRHIAIDANNEYILTGIHRIPETQSIPEQGESFLMSLGNDGSVNWINKYIAPDYNGSSGYRVEPVSSGGYYMTGSIWKHLDLNGDGLNDSHYNQFAVCTDPDGLLDNCDCCAPIDVEITPQYTEPVPYIVEYIDAQSPPEISLNFTEEVDVMTDYCDQYCPDAVDTCLVDLELNKSVDAEKFVIGKEITFTIEVCNKCSGLVTGVEVLDYLPTGLTYFSSTLSTGVYNSATGIWSIGDIEPNTCDTLQIVAVATESGKIVNTAEVYSQDQTDIDSEPANDDGDQSEDDEDSVCVTIKDSGSIGGHCWNDENSDGIQDPNEDGIPGVVVTLTYPDGLTESTTADADGIYLFEELPEDLYTIKVGDGPEGNTLTTPETYTIELNESEDYLNADFGFSFESEENLCGVSVTTILTCECDGQIVVDLLDELIDGSNQWFFELFDESGELLEQNATLSPPIYFEQLCAGDYSIKVTGIANEVEGCVQKFEIPLSNCGFSGCTDPAACNYDSEAITDDGSCEFGNLECFDPCNAIIGCLDIVACNYLPDANCADSTLCDYGSADCPDNPCNPSSCVDACGVSVTTITTDKCNGQITVELSTDLVNGSNQWFFELFDDSGELLEQNATLFPPIYFEQLCAGNYSIKVTGIASEVEGCVQEFEIDLSNFGLSGCTDPAACNYDSEATIDDNSCEFGDSSCFDPCDCDCETPGLFIKHPFLNDLIDPCSCYNQSVTEYDLGAYAFVSIINNSKLKLFFEDGTLYCNNSANFDCVDIYDLNNKVTDTWDCPNIGEAICNPYDDYPWLSDLLPEDECYNTEINVYSMGAYSFVEIIQGEIEVLYLDDGTFYCTNEYGISCKSFYGLLPECLTCNYICPNSDSTSERFVTEINSNLINDDLDFKIFPNPNNGYFKLLLPYSGKTNTFIKMYNTQGQLITEINTIEGISENDFSVNLQDFSNGIYFIEISNSYKSKVKRLVIQR